MRKILYTIALISILMGCSFYALAVGAYPKPITYTQPDGTTVTVMLHGDEFLHWATVGGRLVQRADDGFVYYASFESDGTITRSSVKAGTGMMVMSSSSSTVTPPPAAINRALAKREMMVKRIRSMVASAASSGGASKTSPLVTGEKHFLVILAQTSDVLFTIDGVKTAFTNLLNQSGYSANGGTGSAKDYFMNNSTDYSADTPTPLFTPVFDVIGPVTVSNTMAYYGANDAVGNDLHPDEFVADACIAADADVDFSQYDYDNNGRVDNVFVYYAGHNEAEYGGDDTIWPHRWSLYYQDVTLDGKRVWDYACTSEYQGASGTDMCGIGTFCHEFSHVLGLPDFYDIDYDTNGSGNGLGPFSLMSSGNYNNDGKTPPYFSSMERKLLGWMGEATEITAASAISLSSVKNNVAYSIATGNEDEYYLFEARKEEGWDTPLLDGLLIYHVDQSDNLVEGYTAKVRWDNWNINSVAAHQCFDLVETVPEADIAYMNDYIFPGLGTAHTSFTPATTPAFKAWSGSATGFSITNIAITGTGASFDVSFPGLFSQEGFSVIDSPYASYSRGDNFTLSVTTADTPASVTWTYDGSSKDNNSVVRLNTTGDHTVVATITYSDGRVEVIEKTIVVE